MTTASFSEGQYEGSVHYIDSPVFIFSPAPIIVDVPDAPDGYPYEIKVTNLTTQESFSETRFIHNGRAYFEISRILQHLVNRELSNAFSETRMPRAAVEDFSLTLTDVESQNSDLVQFGFTAIFGALDQLETYASAEGHPAGSPLSRRLWVNYPQTINMHGDDSDRFLLKTLDGFSLDLDITPDYSIAEVDLLESLRNYKAIPPAGDTIFPVLLYEKKVQEILAKFNAGVPVTLGLSVYYQVSSTGAHKRSSDFMYVKFSPDLTPRGVGTYLRWLQRDGSFGYWLFMNGDQATAAHEGNAFQRVVLENPAEPSEFIHTAQFDRNPAHADFTETQTLSLGTYVDNVDEFDYLLGLTTSPIVDRMVYLGDTEIGWQRVNIAPGSYARSRKRATPHRSAFDISIILPQRNTIKL